MRTADEFFQSSNPLAEHYSQFRVSERLLLTGHSHQAWPDVAKNGHEKAWHDAVTYIDDKWQYALDVANKVRAGFARLLNDKQDNIALGQNTHELVVRFLSALDLKKRPKLITTDGEFHTLRRQLNRLEEEGIEIVRIPSHPATEVVERICAQINDLCAAVLLSSVFFHTGEICQNFASLAPKCEQHGVALFLDMYHHLNAIPFDIKAMNLQSAYVVGGGYKYCQLGEGNCFLRIPADCQMRPVITGWFAEFYTLASSKNSQVNYANNAQRFAGSTYDPISHYRAVEVFNFFQQQQLTPALLREISQHQIKLLSERFDALDMDNKFASRNKHIHLEALGGFLALTSPLANQLCQQLHQQGVLCDYRANTLRLGPAPYLSDAQLHNAMDIFESVSKEIFR